MDRPPLGVLVDLDDTLYPQAEFLAQTWDRVAAAGASLGLDRDALRSALGRESARGSDRGSLIDSALAAIGAAPALAPALVGAFRNFRPTTLTPYPGVAERLSRLARSVPLVVVTDGNPEQQRAKLAATGLGGALTGVVCTDEERGRAGRKPHPSGFRRGLSLLGCRTEDAVMVGDRPEKDIAGAVALGIRALRVRQGEYRDRPDPAEVWRSVQTTADALDVLLDLCEGTRR
ncbi:putative hydrolase of the HAD superfamily [Micromonospora pisi]|uniref:Putative hydrolase of the HAD superfamily n=1 Tax=Micromonospora pisi TaxID=589240 RepID=A0A495JVH5_9ACTN|nr:HAD family hydrolase [Micromonospora pisi]RKR92535.1 putative hydrolase of the HAD superfamily [Micromonospora pisi]